MQQELIQFKQEDSKAPFTIKSEIQIQKQKEQDIEIQNLYRMIDKGIDYYNNGQFTFAKVVLYKSSSTLLNQIKKNQISEKEKPPLIKGIIEGQKQLYSWICHMLNQIQYNYLVMKNCNCNWIDLEQQVKNQNTKQKLQQILYNFKNIHTLYTQRLKTTNIFIKMSLQVLLRLILLKIKLMQQIFKKRFYQADAQISPSQRITFLQIIQHRIFERQIFYYLCCSIILQRLNTYKQYHMDFQISLAFQNLQLQ